MIEEVRYHQRRAVTLNWVAAVLMTLITTMLIAFWLALDGPFDSSDSFFEVFPEQGLEENRFEKLAALLRTYWLSAAACLTVSTAVPIVWSSRENAAAQRLLDALKERRPASAALTEADAVIETARAQLAIQRQEAEALEAQIQAAQAMQSVTDEELQRLRTALGLDDAASRSIRSGRVQIALAVASIMLAIVLFLIAR